MKALSEQLSELSARAKRVEDSADAAREKNRAQLQSKREALRTALAAESAREDQQEADLAAAAEDRWNSVRASVSDRFAEMRAAGEERRTERDVRRAERHADAAEQDAGYAVDLALYMVDQAEYAVIDAVIARADAEDLTRTS